jgi:hypothetical protein
VSRSAEPACEVCGEAVDGRGYQVRVPDEPGAFDRIDCALRAAAYADAAEAPEPVALGRLERLAAELFVTRVGKEEDRVERERLEDEVRGLYEQLEAERAFTRTLIAERDELRRQAEAPS